MASFFLRILPPSVFKDCDLGKLSKSEIRGVLRTLLSRKDISHMDLFKAVNILIPEHELLDIAEPSVNVLSKKSFNRLIKDKEVLNGLRLLTFNSLTWENALTKARRDICTGISSGNITLNDSLLDFN